MSWPNRLFFTALVLILWGCGYVPIGKSPVTMPENAKAVHFRKVENPTMEVWLEPALRNALRDEFSYRGGVLWVEAMDSQAILDVNIISYSSGSSLKGGKDETLKSTAEIVVEAKLLRQSDHQEIWNSGRISTSESYIGENERIPAGKRAVDKAAQRITDKLDLTF